MNMRHIIENKLRNYFKINVLFVDDDSMNHQGHAGWREGGETHFTITVVSEDFNGLSRIQRHRKVYDLLRYELASSVHALSIKAYTPEEYPPSALS